MTICTFCPLLCEIVDGAAIDCRLREYRLAALHSTDQNLTALIDGRQVTFEEAIKKANELLSISLHRTITGRIRSVEGTRAALALASRFGAFIDPANSDSAFQSIAAIQRSGMVTASLSEVRFRADCFVLIGDDRTLDVLPRLAHALLQRSTKGEASSLRSPRVVLLGKWSSQSLDRIREFDMEVCSVDIEIEKVPQSLFQWSRCSRDALSMSRNVASHWMAQANYLTLVWSPVGLQMPYADLWIERLLEWIGQRNEVSRCVGFPLASDYVTFQQVCTWITGFPGRVQVVGDDFRYEPDRVVSAMSEGLPNSSMILRIDESLEEDQLPPGPITPTVVISPRLKASEPTPHVFIPCGVAGIDHKATFFRLDATVAMEAFDEQPSAKRQSLPSLAGILEKLVLCCSMLLGWHANAVHSQEIFLERAGLCWAESRSC